MLGEPDLVHLQVVVSHAHPDPASPGIVRSSWHGGGLSTSGLLMLRTRPCGPRTRRPEAHAFGVRRLSSVRSIRETLEKCPPGFRGGGCFAGTRVRRLSRFLQATPSRDPREEDRGSLCSDLDRAGWPSSVIANFSSSPIANRLLRKSGELRSEKGGNHERVLPDGHTAFRSVVLASLPLRSSESIGCRWGLGARSDRPRHPVGDT